MQRFVGIGLVAGVASVAFTPTRTVADGAASVADASPGTDASALMRRVAETYARTARGVVGVRSQSLLTIRAPIFRKRIADDGWFVFVDGALARSSERPDPRQPPLRDPYRPEYARDYAFAYAPCPTCAPGSVAVAFSSATHDVAHATGELRVDVATARILSETETPYKLPWPTQDGRLVATWGAVAEGWFPISIAGEFVGRIGPFVGHATYVQSLSAYGRYPDVASAASALAASPTPTPVPKP